MPNLLEETLEVLRKQGKTLDDIISFSKSQIKDR